MKNIDQSIRQRLLNMSRERNEDFQLILIRFALERFLYRLSKSRYAEQFILKGAFLFSLWTNYRYRPTKDLDLLGVGDRSPVNLEKIFREICGIKVDPDGIAFDENSVTVSEIREEQEYGGNRIRLTGFLGKAKVSLQIDVAYGDAVTPEIEENDFPSMLEMSSPRILTYPKETVVAEKLQSMIHLGMQNSRMKDFFDLFWMSRLFSFEGPVLKKAIQSTFQRRKTPIASVPPLVFSDEFSLDSVKHSQWKAFLNKNDISDMSEDFSDIIGKLRYFLAPPLKSASSGRRFSFSWTPNEAWHPEKQ
jgi:predicted nucleotidyltransferase component of viral defense system